MGKIHIIHILDWKQNIINSLDQKQNIFHSLYWEQNIVQRVDIIKHLFDLCCFSEGHSNYCYPVQAKKRKIKAENKTIGRR